MAKASAVLPHDAVRSLNLIHMVHSLHPHGFSFTLPWLIRLSNQQIQSIQHCLEGLHVWGLHQVWQREAGERPGCHHYPQTLTVTLGQGLIDQWRKEILGRILQVRYLLSRLCTARSQNVGGAWTLILMNPETDPGGATRKKTSFSQRLNKCFSSLCENQLLAPMADSVESLLYPICLVTWWILTITPVTCTSLSPYPSPTCAPLNPILLGSGYSGLWKLRLIISFFIFLTEFFLQLLQASAF